MNKSVTEHGFRQREVALDVPPGGLKWSINDRGVRRDMVSLRLAKAVRAVEGEHP